jgi:hypothetical protein
MATAGCHSEDMISASRVARPCFAIPAASVLVLVSLVSACKSGMHASQRRDAAGPGTVANPSGGFTGTGGTPAMGTGGAGGAMPNPDGGSCRGLELPDFDCGYGTPEYVCIATDGGWAWSFTCPEPPRDASAPPVDVNGNGGSGGKATGGLGTGGSGGGGSGGARTDCAAIAAQIASQTQLVGTCTAVVRLDYASLSMLGHAFVCGRYSRTDEATARKTASADVDFPFAAPAGDSKLLSGPSPEDEWVFLQEPGDFGGVAAVSVRSGRTVFAGSIVWMGTGEILLPTTWDASDLGSGCGPSPHGFTTRGFNLAGGEATPRFDEAADVALATALPAAFSQWGSLLDVVVLLYPRTVGAFDPTKAEYVVLLNAGWLE